MFDLSAIDQHFPMAEYREGQKEAIEFILNAYNSGKNIVICECPTGSGKTAIGMTIANFVRSSYYVTASKQLQDQLIREHGSTVVELKGRNAYKCTYYQRHGQNLVDKKLWTQTQLNADLRKNPDCTCGFCKTKWNIASPTPGAASGTTPGRNSTWCEKCFLSNGINGKHKGSLTVLPIGTQFSACPYYDQLYKAIESKNVAMNYSSFIYQTALTKNRWAPRDLVVLDETHHAEPQLLDFISLSINDSHLQKFGIYIPNLKTPYDYALWFDSIKVHQLLTEAAADAANRDDFRKEEDILRLQRKIDMFMEHIARADTEWISEYEEVKNRAGRYRSVMLKPVYVSGFANEFLFNNANLVLMMSATILDVDVMCRSLGLNRDKIAAYRMKNRFPVENRLIHVQPVGKLTGGRDAMSKWGPALVQGVEKIVRQFSGKRGIIHTHNFAILELLRDKCAKDVRDRFLMQHDFDNDKSKLLVEHGQRDDSVIVAPAMHEGVDLIGDLGRFSIVAKIPYPNFYDDKQLARRMELDKDYYNWLVTCKLIQSVGRCVRSNVDYADTYILDSSFLDFMKRNKKMLPSWFLEAIVYK